MSLETNLMSGLRLSGGGLHLGHYLGCLSPLDQLEGDEPLFFVIRDRGASYFKRQANHDNDLIQILADLMSTPYSDRIIFVLQSKLQPHFAPIYDYLQNLVTLNQLNNVHPHRAKIKNKTSTICISDYLFPIESACTYFVLNADRILMNDDNYATVKFANALSRKVEKQVGYKIFPYPELIHGKLTRLLGYNYEKVSKANGNAVFFSDSIETINHKLEKLLSFKYLYKKYPKLIEERSSLRKNFIIPDEYLPFQYLTIFDKSEKIVNLEDYKKLENHREFSHKFKDIMINFLVNIHDKKKVVMQKTDLLFDKLNSDTKIAEEISLNVYHKFLSK